jgi:hypothetical protein
VAIFKAQLILYDLLHTGAKGNWKSLLIYIFNRLRACILLKSLQKKV